jgi:hypothetical protein
MNKGEGRISVLEAKVDELEHSDKEQSTSRTCKTFGTSLKKTKTTNHGCKRRRGAS